MTRAHFEDILVLTEEEESTPLFVRPRRNHVQVFPGRDGIFWSFVRNLFSVLYPIAHAAMLISFITFFLSSFSFAINCALEITLEMISPHGGSDSAQNFYSCSMSILLCCTLFLVCFVFSLFWEIVKIVVVKRSLKFRVVKVVLFLLILLISGVYAACHRSNYVGLLEFMGCCLIVSWFMAFILSILGSVGLLLFLYKEESHELYALTLLPLLIPFLLFSILAPISFKLVDASAGAMCFAFFYPFLTACLIIYICFRGCRKPNGEYFIIRRRFALLFLVAYCVVLILVISSRQQCKSDRQLSLSNSTTKTLNPREGNENKLAYPICDKTWSSLQLNVADMAFFSQLAYQEKWNSKDLTQTVKSYFHNREGNWKVSFVSHEKPAFFHAVETTRRVHIIGIRGTETARDWFENLKLWSEVFTYQVTSVALPVQRLPLSFVATYVSAASFLERLFHHNNLDFYFSSIESYLGKINRTEASSVLLAGHSLGGGLAKIVGSRNRIEAVSFSSPGEVYNHVKFGYSLDDVKAYTTSVGAPDDVITWLDMPGGLVQYITCGVGGFRKCHSIVNTYCELKASCRLETAVICDS